ncbi:hypothetical protein CXB51_007692 [Gossypium anomalum]|uniref:Uncharacterized protein n=1 Tax=Gossypium anomalum TaxID=47600 RepID=A0A8J6D5K2_9ROSI|nr:hypothetical protein CXB51_007692 [Gossypium anomalum]
MQILIDLRYATPPLVNVIWFLLVASQNDSAFDLLSDSLPVSTSILVFFALFVAIKLMGIFLYFSVEIPLTPHPVCLRARGFSIAFFISLLASIFLPSSVFLVTYLFIVVTVPWHNKLFHQFICFLRLFAITIQAIGQHNHEIPAQAPPTPPPQVLELQV